MEGDKPYRFISFNIPNLHLVEDNMAFAEENPWRLPDRFEIFDALASVRQQGGQVVRTYVLSVVRSQRSARRAAARARARASSTRKPSARSISCCKTANETGVRVIVPFVDNWVWWGGKAEYAGFRGKKADDFWTDPQVIADFKETIRFVLERTNTLTGVKYPDDKAILAWETGNELESPPAWTREIAAYIKSLDQNHPVIDGYHNDDAARGIARHAGDRYRHHASLSHAWESRSPRRFAKTPRRPKGESRISSANSASSIWRR